MPIKIIREAYREEVYERFLEYPKLGTLQTVWIPVDENNQLLAGCADLLKENYERIKSGELKVGEPILRRIGYTIKHPEVRECKCGDELEMNYDSDGITFCHCGRSYNPAGQELRPRSEWEERYDDDY